MIGSGSTTAKQLNGVVVLELARFISGPLCGLMLADLGAQVTKIETGSGDPSRGEGPWIDGTSLYFAQMNRGKTLTSLDLRSESGRAELWALIERADVIIENFRPGVFDQMGFAPGRIHQANPGCVLVSVSAYPSGSAWGDRGAFDEIIQCVSGLASLTGGTDDFPLLIGTHLVDVTAGLLATIGSLGALQERERTGRGTHIRTSLLDASITLMGPLVPAAARGEAPERVRNRDRTAAPANTFAARDGHVYVHAGSESFWRSALDVVGREDLIGDPRFESDAARLTNATVAEEVLAKWIATKSVDEVADAMNARGVLAAPVNDLPAAVQRTELGIERRLREYDVEGRAVRLVGPVIDRMSMDGGNSGPG